MKPLKTLINKKSGVILVDFITVAGLALVFTLVAVWLALHTWSYSYLNTEAYYLARASLYGNAHMCAPADHLVSQKLIKRRVFCQSSGASMNYHLLPDIQSRDFNLSVRLEVR